MVTHTEQNRIKRRSCVYWAALFSISLTSMQSVASASVHELLDYGPPEDMSSPMAATATFQQTASSGTDASSVSKVTLKYFTSTNCSGAAAGTYTTPDGTSYSINTSTTFGLNATSTYAVGNAQGLTMSNMNSVAIFLKSTNNNTPQANFTGTCGTNGSSANTGNFGFCCVQINCSSGTECTQTSAIGTQNFQLKTTASIGDPADGGKIACMSGANNLIVPATDNSTAIKWTNSNAVTGATSTTDGSSNTTTIIGNASCTGSTANCAAYLCNTYTATGGFTTGWFLPAGNNSGATGQLNCLYTNKTAIGGFAFASYWSSTEFDSDNAWLQGFGNGVEFDASKNVTFRVRCARAFTP